MQGHIANFKNQKENWFALYYSLNFFNADAYYSLLLALWWIWRWGVAAYEVYIQWKICFQVCSPYFTSKKTNNETLSRFQMKHKWHYFFFSSFSGKQYKGPNDIFSNLSDIRRKLAGKWPPEKLIHVVEKLQCRAHGEGGVAIRVSGSFIVGNQFIICGDGMQVEGLPNFRDLDINIADKRMGTFKEQFVIEASDAIGCYQIVDQELYIMSPNT